MLQTAFLLPMFRLSPVAVQHYLKPLIWKEWGVTSRLLTVGWWTTLSTVAWQLRMCIYLSVFSRGESLWNRPGKNKCTLSQILTCSNLPLCWKCFAIWMDLRLKTDCFSIVLKLFEMCVQMFAVFWEERLLLTGLVCVMEKSCPLLWEVGSQEKFRM